MACLDAWAVLAWLEGEEPGARRVERAMSECVALMSWINVGEVSYVLQRVHGPEASAEVVAALRASCTLEEPTATRVLQAADVKARHAVSYADAFAIATARAHRLRLLTGDPEILAAVTGGEVDDLRAP